MATKRKYIEEITVYDISAATGYKGSGLTGINADGDEVAIEIPTDEKCQNYFTSKIYSSLPSVDSEAPLTANDLSTIFNYKSYANADAAKAGVLSTDYISWIDSNTESASYEWSNGKLKITLFFADQSNYDTWLTGVKINNKRTFLETGVTVSTVNS
jgi:hypothetical protein